MFASGYETPPARSVSYVSASPRKETAPAFALSPAAAEAAEHPARPASRPKIDNLDLVRAIAILMVLVFHSVQLLPTPPMWLVWLVRGGQLGVDVFFVLSGFLIGRLWWLEEQARGTVRPVRFFLRRALRTIPPYLVILLVSWLAVWMQRREPFDVAFLLMVQNYRDAIPFFVVSWSLCVEEHFYLALPLLLTLLPRRIGVWVVAASALLPMLLRFVHLAYTPGIDFGLAGFSLTATHLRFEGLAAGVAVAWLHVHRPGWMRLRKAWAVAAAVTSAAMVLAFEWMTGPAFYVVGYSVLAVLFTMVVGYVGECRALPLSKSPAVRLISRMTYSLYLTHSLAIQLLVRGMQRAGVEWQFPIWLGMIIAMGVIGYATYRLVERPSILLRDRLVA